MDWRGLIKFTTESNIKDSTINSGVLSTYAAAINFHQINTEADSVKICIRYEFLELLVRMARGKYIDFGTMRSLADSTQRLLDRHLLPLEEQCAFYEEWRYKYLYTNEVNEILMANIKAINRLYEQIAAVQNAPRMNNLVDDYQGKCPTIDQILYLLYRKIKNVDRFKLIQAFYSSKMLVSEESTAAGLTEYTILQWSEFPEFIGRLAQFKYRGEPDEEEISLSAKICIVLDEILPIVGATRSDPRTETIVISESDEDY